MLSYKYNVTAVRNLQFYDCLTAVYGAERVVLAYIFRERGGWNAGEGYLKTMVPNASGGD